MMYSLTSQHTSYMYIQVRTCACLYLFTSKHSTDVWSKQHFLFISFSLIWQCLFHDVAICAKDYCIITLYQVCMYEITKLLLQITLIPYRHKWHHIFIMVTHVTCITHFSQADICAGVGAATLTRCSRPPHVTSCRARRTAAWAPAAAESWRPSCSSDTASCGRRQRTSASRISVTSHQHTHNIARCAVLWLV